MKIVLALLVACHPAPAPAIANSAEPIATARVPFAPCPLEPGTIEHELFPSCAPAPFNEPLAPCPHGECPRPCRVEAVGGGVQRIEYDGRGRFVAARGDDDKLRDQTCTYTGDRVARCDLLYKGESLIGERVFRDDRGRISGVSSGDEMDGMHPTYIWRDGRVVKISSTMHAGDYQYRGDHLVVMDDINMDEVVRTTFTYDAAGDVASSSKDGAYRYDDRKRLVAFGSVRLVWDSEDRLIGSTVGTTSYRYTYECK